MIKMKISYDVLASGAVRGRMTSKGVNFSYTYSERLPKGSKKEDIPVNIKKAIEKGIQNQYEDYVKKGSPSKDMRCGDWIEYWLAKYKKPLDKNEFEEGEKVPKKRGGRVTMPTYNRLWQTLNTVKSSESGKQVLRKHLKNITSENLEDIFLELEERNLSASSRKKVKCLFNASFNKAIQNGYLILNPVSNIVVQESRKNKDSDILDYIPMEYFKAVIEEALRTDEKGKYIHDYGAGVVLQLLCGCRCGELRALSWDDVEDNCFHIRHSVSLVNYLDDDGKPVRGKQHVFISSTKNLSSIRMIPFEKGDIIDQCINILRDRYENRVKNTSNNTRKLVMGTSTGWYLTVNNYSKYLKRILEVAIPESNMSSHKLRHSFIAMLVNDENIDIPSVAALVGHRDTRVTLMYANHTQESVKRMVMKTVTGFAEKVLQTENPHEE